MPFKTAYGNTSAKTAWGQWAPFSLGLGKLSGYSGRVPKLSVNNITPPKEQLDWTNVAMGVKAGFDNWAQEHDAESAKDVEKYLREHSTEELGQLMRERQIPFQDDPWAMAHFNKKMGEIHSGIAEMEFQQKIQNGEYDKLSPEQLDAAHYDFNNEYLKGVQASSNGFLDGYADGSHFKEGFFRLTPKQRLTAIGSQQKRQNDILVQKSELADLGKVNAYLSSGTATADGLIDILNDVQNTGGYHRTPDEVYKFIAGFTKRLPEMGTRGAQLIDELRNREIPGAWGLTLEQIYSKEGLDTLKVNSLNNQYSSDLIAKANFERDITRIARNGDGIAEATLKGLLEREAKASGGKETWKSKTIVQGLKQLDIIKQKNQAEARAETKRIQQFALLGQWTKDALEGKAVEDYKSFLRRNAIKEADTEAFWGNIIEGTFASNDVASMQAVLNLASQPKAPTKLTKGVSSYLTGIYNQDFMAAIDRYRQGEGISVAVDPQTGDELPSYTYVPLGAGTPVKADALPKDMRVLMDIFRSNPSAVKKIFSKGENSKIYNDLCLVDSALNQKLNPIKYVGDIKEAESKMTKEQKEELKVATDDNSKAFFKGGFGDITGAGSTISDGIFKAQVKARAEELYRANLGQRDFADCFKDAKTEVASQYVTLGNVLVPKADISGGFLSLMKVAGDNTDVDREISNRLEYFNGVIKKLLKEKRLDKSSDYLYSYYDEANNEIRIVDKDFQWRDSINIKELAIQAENEYLGETKRKMTGKDKEDIYGYTIDDR